MSKRGIFVSVAFGGVCAAMLVAALSNAATPCPPVHLNASDSFPFTSFGWSVALDDTTAMVGMQTGNQVHVFRREPAGWVQTQQLEPPVFVPGTSFGYQLSLDGQYALVVGGVVAPHPAEGYMTAPVTVLKRTGDTWSHSQFLFASGAVLGEGLWYDGFGSSVVLAGDVAIIGAPSDSQLGIQAGAAYMFRYDPVSSLWLQEQKLLASDAEANDFFGRTVYVRGDVAMIAGDMHPSGRGATYVFKHDSRTGAWSQAQKLVASDAHSSDSFGAAIAIDGNVAFIAAPGVFWGVGNTGAAYVFRYNGSEWVQQQKIKPPDAWAQSFGDPAVDGDRAILGASGPSVGPGSYGAAYFYRFDGQNWVHQQTFLPQFVPGWSAFFGSSVALDGRTALIGAFGEDFQAGSAYVYTLDPVPADLNCDGRVSGIDLAVMLASWGSQQRGVKPDPADLNGDGQVDGNDLGMLLGAWGS